MAHLRGIYVRPIGPVPRLWDKPSELGQLCTMPTVRQRID
nr:MAG TPA: hypothetical protein [Caudoviricetes sp.]